MTANPHRFSCPQPEDILVELSPCDVRAGNCPIHKRCPDFDYCQVHGLDCKAYRNYVNGKDRENMLMDRQFGQGPMSEYKGAK